MTIYNWEHMDDPPPLADVPMSKFECKMTDEIAVGSYSTKEFEEVRDYIFGMAAQGFGMWQCIREEAKCWTTYKGEGSQDFAQLFVAWCRGEAIRFMTLRGWR